MGREGKGKEGEGGKKGPSNPRNKIIYRSAVMPQGRCERVEGRVTSKRQETMVQGVEAAARTTAAAVTVDSGVASLAHAYLLPVV